MSKKTAFRGGYGGTGGTPYPRRPENTRKFVHWKKGKPLVDIENINRG